MAESPKVVADLTEKLVSDLTNSLQRDQRIGKTKRYLEDDQDLPYAPQGARDEYRKLQRESITNWVKKVSDAYTQSLFVDGYRAARVADNASPWEHWVRNGINARQTIVIRSALEYGVGYGLVLPGPDGPVMKALPATRCTAFYEDEDDEWPIVALYRKGVSTDLVDELYEVFDDEFVYDAVRDGTGKIRITQSRRHGLGVCPVVRFRTRLGCESVGVVWPLLGVQDRINEIVFSTQIAIQYASFRQRWVVGLGFPEDENGNPVSPFEMGVDRLVYAEDPEVKFGEFNQTDINGHGTQYLSAVRTLAALGQISPAILLGDLVNLSADALASLQKSTQDQLNEFQTLMGESFEQWLRLAALAAGDIPGATDRAAEIRWRDNEPRSLAATVDALTKMVAGLQVPAQGLWEKIPGVTDGDIERWKNEANSSQYIEAMLSALDRQAAPAEPATDAAPEAA